MNAVDLHVLYAACIVVIIAALWIGLKPEFGLWLSAAPFLFCQGFIFTKLNDQTKRDRRLAYFAINEALLVVMAAPLMTLYWMLR